jgi:hypothetical protein
MAIVICTSNNSSLSFLELGRQYAAAETAAEKEIIISAATAIRNSDMWHGTGSYASGFLLQGGAVLFSVVMFGSRHFMRATAVAGILANGLDLIQHLIHMILPDLATPILMTSGIFYILWFPLLTWDLFKNSLLSYNTRIAEA